jgi:hypothetical protein
MISKHRLHTGTAAISNITSTMVSSFNGPYRVGHRSHNFPHFPLNKILHRCARRTGNRKIRLSGQDTLGRPEDTRSYLSRVLDMQSHLCRGDMRHFSTFSTPPRMPIRTLICPTAYDLRAYCRGGTGDCNGTWIRDADPMVAILRSILREKKRIFIRKELKAELSVLIIRKKIGL